MSAITFTAVGDCIVDHYILQKKKYLGGTATNSAYAAKKAGAKSYIISAVGKDPAGRAFVQACKKERISTNYLRVVPGSTSTLDITLENIDSPEYSNWQLGVLENFTLEEKTKDFLRKVDIAKTMLFWPMKKMFVEFADLDLPNTLKIGDFSGVSQYTESVDALSKYAYGFDIMVKSLDKNDTKLMSTLKKLAEKKNTMILGLVGEKGSMVFTKHSVFSHPAKSVKVVDTNGAGDAFVATFAVVYKQSNNIFFSLNEATKAAQKAVSHFGAIPFRFNG